MSAWRQFNLFLFVFCTTVVIGAYCLQVLEDISPCCLCIIQRLTLIALAVSFLLYAFKKSRPKRLWLYTIINLAFVSMGLLASARQIWLQNKLIGGENLCMPTLPVVFNHSALVQLLNGLGTHQCAQPGPYVLGLDLSIWTFLLLSLLVVVILMTPWLFRKFHTHF